MLRQVSNGQYLEAIRMAEKFILHVEVLFATIDDLEFQFSRLNIKGKHSSIRLKTEPLAYSIQACLMYERPVCFVARLSTFSHSFHIPKKLVLGEWV